MDWDSKNFILYPLPWYPMVILTLKSNFIKEKGKAELGWKICTALSLGYAASEALHIT